MTVVYNNSYAGVFHFELLLMSSELMDHFVLFSGVSEL